ncbi:MAG: glutathione S-transferase family protein [Gammaproteobacteria bacterium]|nr:glutathione S-transferase family protein [Gammaproteobacteria bacterium]
MDSFTLVIGNKAYSSWSLRPWLAMKHVGIPFAEIRIPLTQPESEQRVREYSPSGRVPVLKAGGLDIWDSLAICEYPAEQFPQHTLWPGDVAARAVARSVSAEMHAGFSALRENMTHNVRKSLPGKGRAPGVQEDIDRICAIWRDCRARFGTSGEMLFGRFSIADAMYAPVVNRFVTYGVDVDPVSAAYMRTIQALPALQQWIAEARSETEVIQQFER